MPAKGILYIKEEDSLNPERTRKNTEGSGGGRGTTDDKERESHSPLTQSTSNPLVP